MALEREGANGRQMVVAVVVAQGCSLARRPFGSGMQQLIRVIDRTEKS
jgi:hypothetical protein